MALTVPQMGVDVSLVEPGVQVTGASSVRSLWKESACTRSTVLWKGKSSNENYPTACTMLLDHTDTNGFSSTCPDYFRRQQVGSHADLHDRIRQGSGEHASHRRWSMY